MLTEHMLKNVREKSKNCLKSIFLKIKKNLTAAINESMILNEFTIFE